MYNESLLNDYNFLISDARLESETLSHAIEEDYKIHINAILAQKKSNTFIGLTALELQDMQMVMKLS